MEATESWFDIKAGALTMHVNNPKENSEALTAKAFQFKTAAKLQSAISKGVVQKPAGKIANISPADCQTVFQVAELVKNNELKSAIDFINSSWPDGFVDGSAVETAFINPVISRCQELLGAGQKIHEWTVLQNVVKKCQDFGSGSFLIALEKVGAKEAPFIFEKRFLEQWVEAALSTESRLKGIYWSAPGRKN